MPSTPSVDGAKTVFVGWSKDKNSAVLWNFAADKVTDNLTLYAVWSEENNYNITLDVNGGTELEVTTYAVELDKPYSLGVATKVGYIFLGWSAEWFDGGELMTDAKGASLANWNYEESKTLTALWSAAEYTATLDVNGGSALAEADKTIKVAYDSQPNFKVPNKTGHNFIGWFDGTTQITDNSGKLLSKWNFTDNKTLKAEWAVSKYFVNLNVNGGAAIPSSSVNVAYDSDFSFNVPTKTGYTFQGWYEGDTQITDIKGNGLAKWTFTNSKNLTAKWTVNNYIVTFDVDDGVTLGSPTMEVTYDSTFKLQVPTRDNWVFKGWYIGNTQLTDEQGNPYFEKVDNEPDPIILWSTAADTTVTARWEVNEYTLALDVNGGDALPEGSTSQLVIIGSDYKLPVPTRDLFLFLGWYDSNTQLTDANGNSIVKWDIRQNKTLTAKWGVDDDFSIYTFTITDDGCTITGVLDTGVDTLYIPNYVTGIAKDAFVGCDQLETVYYLGEKTDWDKVTIGEGNDKLTAVVSYFSYGEPNLNEKEDAYDSNYWRYIDGVIVKWEFYTLSYDVDGGAEIKPNIANVTYGNAYQLSVTTKDNYTFSGWMIENTLITDNEGKSLAVWEYTEGKTLTAKWQANLFDVTLTTNISASGTLEGAGAHAYGSEATIKAVANAGYTFLGWYNGDTLLTEEAEYRFTIEKEVEYTAKFEANKYTVTYDANGGKIEAATQEVIFGNSNALGVPTRMGNYVFAGWFVGDRLVTDTTVWDIAENTVLIAKWEIDNALDIFEYCVTADGCIITGVRDTEVEIITIPLGYITGIEADAFDKCTKLKAFLFEEDEYVAGYLGAVLQMFAKVYYSASLFEYDLEADGYVIKSVKNTADSTVIIPSNVTAIANDAFSACTQLKDVLFAGDKDGYDKIVIGEGNDVIGTATVSYLNSEEPNLADDKTRYEDNYWRYLDNLAVKWEVYVLTYNVDGGKPMDPAQAYVTYGNEYKLSIAVKDGYTFLGWYDGETQLTNDKGECLAVWNNLEGKTIIAKWQANEYTVTYNADGGEVDSATQKVTFGAKFELSVPTKEGFTFKGWYLTDGESEVLVSSGNAWNYANDVTLTAKWEITVTE